MKKGIKQHDTRDCGAACLASILLWYGAHIPLIELRQKMRVDKNGANILAICKTASMYGLDSEGCYVEPEEFFDNIGNECFKLPVIVHTILENHMQHYIVVKKILPKDRIVVFDPQTGEKVLRKEEFQRIFTGYFITVLPNSSFCRKKKDYGRYKKYLKIITMQRKKFLAAIICSLVAAILSITASLTYQTIIDKHILGNETSLFCFSEILNGTWFTEGGNETLIQLIVAIAGIYILQALIGGIRGIIVTCIFKNSTYYLFSLYYKHLLRLPISFFHDRETGEVLSRFQDMHEIQTVISGIGLTIFLDFFMAVAGGIVLCSISEIMFLIVLAMVGLYGLIAFLYKKPIRNINREILEADAQVTCELKEVVGGIESIKSFGSEAIFDNRLSQKTEQLVSREVKGSFISVSQSTLSALAESLGSIFILGSGCYFMIQGGLTLGQFIAFETLIYFFISPVQGLLLLQIELQKGFVAAERLDDVLEVEQESEPQGIVNFCLKDAKTSTSYDIDVNNLSFSYGFRENILNNLSFSVLQSEKVHIKGKSGCGKTTLLQLLGKIETQYEGVISLGKKELGTIPAAEYRKYVVYVPQNAEFFSGTIMENILLGRTISEPRLKTIIQGCQLEDFLYGHEEGFGKYIEENGKNLSGGQKQRIALARALITHPQVLLLDESLCHLDEETEKSILNYLWEAFPQMTIIAVSHKTYTDIKYDKVILLS